MPIDFDILSVHGKVKESFNYIQKLKKLYGAPQREPYRNFLKRQLQSLSKEDAKILIKLVIKSICCPVVHDPEIYQKILSDDGIFLKQLFENYVNPDYLNEVLVNYRNMIQVCISSISSFTQVYII